MPKSHLAEKNISKEDQKNIKKDSTKNRILEAELVSNDVVAQAIPKTSPSKTKKGAVTKVTLDSASMPTKVRKNKKTTKDSIAKDSATTINNDSSHDDADTFTLENDDVFNLDNTHNSDDILHTAELEEADYLDEDEDETDMDTFDSVEDQLYALDSYNHSKDLPALSQKHLPTTLIQDNLQLFIREISKFPLLKPEEEVELARRVRDEGDKDAAFRIISSHLRLVVKISMDFQRRWMQNVLDLIQEGNVGLMRAVNKFDPDKGIKFSYYASFWIKAYILKFIMDNWRMVKIGTTQAQRKLFYNLNKERQKLIIQGFDPDADNLAKSLGVSVEQVIEMQQRLDSSDMSLDLPVNDENGSTSRIDFLPALGPGIEDAYAKTEIANLVHDSISGLMPKLSDKETFILENRLLTDDPVTLREIGEKYNVTRERIRQLEARLLVKLRNHMGEEIKDFSESWIQP